MYYPINNNDGVFYDGDVLSSFYHSDPHFNIYFRNYDDDDDDVYIYHKNPLFNSDNLHFYDDDAHFSDDDGEYDVLKFHLFKVLQFLEDQLIYPILIDLYCNHQKLYPHFIALPNITFHQMLFILKFLMFFFLLALFDLIFFNGELLQLTKVMKIYHLDLIINCYLLQFVLKKFVLTFIKFQDILLQFLHLIVFPLREWIPE